jgi:hypothetical protein
MEFMEFVEFMALEFPLDKCRRYFYPPIQLEPRRDQS